MGSNPDGAKLVFLYFSTIYIYSIVFGEDNRAPEFRRFLVMSFLNLIGRPSLLKLGNMYLLSKCKLVMNREEYINHCNYFVFG